MSGLKKTVLGAIGGRFLPQAIVDDLEIISERFRLVVLKSEKLKQAELQPAAKFRINAGNWEMRAYTPYSIDAEAGRIAFLAYLHGDGPGSSWVRSAVPGDVTHVLGPQMSLELKGLSQPAVFFGDETSFAAAKTLQSHFASDNATRFVFEISDAGEAQTVIDRLELRNVRFYERQEDGAHIASITEAIQQALGNIATPHLVLTGNGRSIQAIRAGLRASPSSVIDYRVKAYWAPGKTGLE